MTPAAPPPDPTAEVGAPPPPSAPDSPRIKETNKRVLQVGCAPMMVAGFIAGFLRGVMDVNLLVALGAGLTVLVVVPLLGHSWRLRRENRRRFAAAQAEAEQVGGRVRAVETPEGDYRYEVVERAPPVDLDALVAEETAEASEATDQAPDAADDDTADDDVAGDDGTDQPDGAGPEARRTAGDAPG